MIWVEVKSHCGKEKTKVPAKSEKASLKMKEVITHIDIMYVYVQNINLWLLWLIFC